MVEQMPWMWASLFLFLVLHGPQAQLGVDMFLVPARCHHNSKIKICWITYSYLLVVYTSQQFHITCEFPRAETWVF